AAESTGVTPAGLPEPDRLAISEHFTEAALRSLTVEKALNRRNHEPGTGPLAVERQIARAEGRLGIGPGVDEDDAPRRAPAAGLAPRAKDAQDLAPGLTIRRARPDDVPGIAAVMADYVLKGDLLPRPVSELYQCVREFHIVTRDRSGSTP